jgi:hypothetical protein
MLTPILLMLELFYNSKLSRVLFFLQTSINQFFNWSYIFIYWISFVADLRQVLFQSSSTKICSTHFFLSMVAYFISINGTLWDRFSICRNRQNLFHWTLTILDLTSSSKLINLKSVKIKLNMYLNKLTIKNNQYMYLLVFYVVNTYRIMSYM